MAENSVEWWNTSTVRDAMSLARRAIDKCLCCGRPVGSFTSQRSVGEAAGISASRYGAWERGVGPLTATELKMVMCAVGLRADDLRGLAAAVAEVSDGRLDDYGSGPQRRVVDAWLRQARS